MTSDDQHLFVCIKKSFLFFFFFFFSLLLLLLLTYRYSFLNKIYVLRWQDKTVSSFKVFMIPNRAVFFSRWSVQWHCCYNTTTNTKDRIKQLLCTLNTATLAGWLCKCVNNKKMVKNEIKQKARHLQAFVR